jgi:pSer/pThr/pTyr-binding forkhead associated (FHA) protein
MGNKTEKWKRLTLVVVEKNKSKEEYKLDRPTIGIGRSHLNQIVLRNRGVSPFHARITVEGRKCVITDLGSHQGVKVNGEKIDTEELYPGDEIQIGRVHLKVASDIPEKRVVVRKEETPRRKEQTPRRKKVKLHIPVRLIIILVIIFVVILILDIHLLVQLINWQ